MKCQLLRTHPQVQVHSSTGSRAGARQRAGSRLPLRRKTLVNTHIRTSMKRTTRQGVGDRLAKAATQHMGRMAGGVAGNHGGMDSNLSRLSYFCLSISVLLLYGFFLFLLSLSPYNCEECFEKKKRTGWLICGYEVMKYLC